MKTEKNISKEEKSKKKGLFSRLVGSVAENVKEGASFVGEKVAETSAKAYEAGTELVHETSDKIHDFTEKQSLQKEEDKIEDRQKTLKYAFGELTLTHYLEADSLHKAFLSTKPVEEIVSEYKANQKRMRAIRKEMKEIENH